MGFFVNILSCLIVGAFWGITNPLIRRYTTETQFDTSRKPAAKFLAELGDLLRNWKYIILFLINQSGSILFFLTLQNADLSLAVPVANALTFVFTGVTGAILGETNPDGKTLLGVSFIVVGITFCLIEKLNL